MGCQMTRMTTQVIQMNGQTRMMMASEIIVTVTTMGMGPMTLRTYFLKIQMNMLIVIWMESAIMRTWMMTMMDMMIQKMLTR
jgi:hypothetical protein